MSAGVPNVEFHLETAYEAPPALTDKEREQLLEKLSQTNSVEDLAEAIKQLKQENEKLPEKIQVDKPKEIKSLQITPNPEFSYKTLRKHDQRKTFINITSHEILDKPGMKKKLDKDGNEVEGINIPISVGMPREEVDKKGVNCLVYDLIVNPEVIKEVEADNTGRYRDFICQLGIQSLEQKYKEEYDKKYKIPKLKYFGETIPQQTIQDRKNIPKIEEVKSTNSKKSVVTPAAAIAKPVVAEIEKEVNGTGYWIAVQSDYQFLNAMVDHSYIYELLVKVKEVLPMLVTPSTENLQSPSTSSTASFQKLNYSNSLSDYVDPIAPLPSAPQNLPIGSQTIGFSVEIEFQSYLTIPALLNQIQVSISPFKTIIKLPQYKKWVGFFPIAISPIYSYYIITELAGFVSQKRLILYAMIDFVDYAVNSDPGSKTWLVTQALNTDNGSSSNSDLNPYQLFSTSNSSNKSGDQIGDTFADGNSLPEDKFHIALPKNVDQYTGLPVPQSENGLTGEQLDQMELPEDRFHRKDAGSSFILQQREQSKKDKWDKYEKEKQERKDDPNVEYIDMNSFKPGGKEAPNSTIGTKVGSDIVPEELKQAKSLLQASEFDKVKDTISTTVWTDLLD